jgi:hypothetical protein
MHAVTVGLPVVGFRTVSLSENTARGKFAVPDDSRRRRQNFLGYYGWGNEERSANLSRLCGPPTLIRVSPSVGEEMRLRPRIRKR